MKKITRVLIAAIMSIIMFTLAACGTAANQGKSSGNEDTIVVGFTSDLKTLDPGNAYEVFANMYFYATYDNLFKIVGDSDEPQPWLVDTYEVDDSKTEYSFILKDGLKFSSGNELTSEDVAFSFNRTKNLKGNTSHHTENIDKIETPDAKTVVITLKEPDAGFFTRLCTNSFAVVDSKVVKENGATDAEDASQSDTARTYLDANSAGSGAYVLKSWTNGVELTLEANPNYWGEQPKVSTIILKEIKDVNSQIQQLEKGDIDIALNLTVENASSLEGKDGIDLINEKTATTTFLLMNEDKDIGGPMSNADVQQAVRYAINYEELLTITGEGSLLPTANVPIGLTGAVEKDSNYQDLEKAKELMKKAGYEDGFEINFTVADSDTEGASWTTMAQKIKADLQKINIEAKIVTGEIGSVIDSYREGKEGFLFMHWSVDYPDINNQLAFLPGETVGLRANWEAGANERLDELKKIISEESDPTKRAAASEEMQEIFLEDSPYAFLVQHPKVLGVRSDLTGVYYNDICKVQLDALSRTK